MAHLQTVVEILGVLSSYYDKEPTELQTRVYFRTLEDISDELLEKAAYDWIAQSQWFPKVSELRQLAQRISSNYGESVQYDKDKPKDARLYWLAMDVFNASLRGEISAAQLDTDKAWRGFLRQHYAVEDMTAWELAQQQTSEWMTG